MNSGAEASAAPPELFGTAVEGSPMSAVGASWTSACGNKIPALGQTEVEFEDATARSRILRFEVADVQEPLISTADVCDAGNFVVYHKKGGFICNLKTGSRIPFERTGGRYELVMTLPPTTGEEGEEEQGAGHADSFRRPER